MTVEAPVETEEGLKGRGGGGKVERIPNRGWREGGDRVGIGDGQKGQSEGVTRRSHARRPLSIVGRGTSTTLNKADKFCSIRAAVSPFPSVCEPLPPRMNLKNRRG